MVVIWEEDYFLYLAYPKSLLIIIINAKIRMTTAVASNLTLENFDRIFGDDLKFVGAVKGSI